MQAGASLGLQARGQDIAQAEAGDRLRLAYDQLASEERARSQAAQARVQLAHAQLALRGQQMSMLEQYRQDRMKQQADEAAERIRLGEERLAEARKPTVHFGTAGEVTKYDPTTEKVTTLKEGRPQGEFATVTEPVDPQLPLGAKVTRKVPVAEAQQMLKSGAAKTTPAAAPGFQLLHPATWFGGRTGAPPSAATAPTAAAAPFKENALIRNRKTGKLYRVVNGQPVEETNSPSSDNEQEE